MIAVLSIKLSLKQLLHMDGLRREVLLYSGKISYFESGFELFMLSGNHIVAAISAIFILILNIWQSTAI